MLWWGAPDSQMANTWPFATGEVGLKWKCFIWQFWETITVLCHLGKSLKKTGLFWGWNCCFEALFGIPRVPDGQFFCNNPWRLILKYLQSFYDNRVDFFGYRTSNSLLYLEFTRIDPKMAYLGHFSKFSQQNFSKHTWGPTYRAREGPCTSGNVESFFFWYHSWALVCVLDFWQIWRWASGMFLACT